MHAQPSLTLQAPHASGHCWAVTKTKTHLNNKLMKFPIANVSIKDWDPEDDYLKYILENQFIYSNSTKLYRDYFLNNKFVDSNGEVYQVIDIVQPGLLRQLFSFIPGVYKGELIFSTSGELLDLEQVRQHILKQINKLENDGYKQEWIKKIKDAPTYEDVILS